MTNRYILYYKQLIFYPSIAKKLREKHDVLPREVYEAFENLTGNPVRELREKNIGTHPKYWFVSETHTDRRLKIVFADDPDEKGLVVITAYEPNETEERLYEKKQKK